MIYRFLCQNRSKSACGGFFYVDIFSLVVIFFFFVTYLCSFWHKVFCENISHLKKKYQDYKIFRNLSLGTRPKTSDNFFLYVIFFLFLVVYPGSFWHEMFKKKYHALKLLRKFSLNFKKEISESPKKISHKKNANDKLISV